MLPSPTLSYPHRFCPVSGVWPCVCQSKPWQLSSAGLLVTELSNRKLQPPESSSGHNATCTEIHIQCTYSEPLTSWQSLTTGGSQITPSWTKNSLQALQVWVMKLLPRTELCYFSVNFSWIYKSREACLTPCSAVQTDLCMITYCESNTKAVLSL